MRSPRLGIWVAAVLALVVAGGCRLAMPDDRPKIVIHFGIDGDQLEGAGVEIDGKVVGKLHKLGQNPTTAFLVAKGDHTVRLRHPHYACEAARVAAEHRATRYHLMVDFASDRDGRTVLVLQR